MCVTTTAVIPIRTFRSASKAWIPSAVCGSRLPVGSSASSSFGWRHSARARATRCCSPPDSSPGRCSIRSPRPTVSSISAARRRASARATRRMSAGIMAFSSAVNSGSRWWLWNTNPMVWFRNAARPSSPRPNTSSPSNRTRPREGTSSAPSRCRNVLLPAPDGPVSATSSPAAISRSMPRSTSRRFSPMR
ncbi:protein of unknown function DUF1602 [Anaeromyxobacter dehalogenans 2CP-C]|uniref:Uncharacterized protein n=1 Tax=Anaeromyxobacter dehalogenans (strain 2CP-C) TaxID=290397 RepID=Q2IPX3_ANADE|nr:protein of unknown function DUF1602 [Anaeromyxobacter dehalogenans 2CP-C]